jgi:outer membrane protein assembly factor BamB
MGTSAFGVASDKGAELLSVTTGAALYTDPHPAKRVFYRANEGFVFASDDEVWFIDEKTPRERWRQHVDRVADAAFIHADVSPTFLITRLDHSYSELAYADGKLSSGQCTGILDEDTHKASFCAGRPPASSNKEAVSLVARSADLVTYYATIGVSGTDRLSSFDQVGRKRWDSAWPIKTAEIERPAMFAPKAGLVGFVLTPGEGDRTFLVFDDATGAAQFQRTLSAKEWIAGITDSCWIIVREKDVACLDARSGNDHWNVRTAGTDAGAWPLAGGGALVADSNPLTLSRIDDTGKRVWQTELPDTELQHGKYGDWRLMTGDERWRLSDVLGIRTGVSSTVIDLASGKLETMHR